MDTMDNYTKLNLLLTLYKEAEKSRMKESMNRMRIILNILLDLIVMEESHNRDVQDTLINKQ